MSKLLKGSIKLKWKFHRNIPWMGYKYFLGQDSCHLRNANFFQDLFGIMMAQEVIFFIWASPPQSHVCDPHRLFSGYESFSFHYCS